MFFGDKLRLDYRLRMSEWRTNCYEMRRIFTYDPSDQLYKSFGRPAIGRRLNHLGDPPEFRETADLWYVTSTWNPHTMEFVKCWPISHAKWPSDERFHAMAKDDLWLRHRIWRWRTQPIPHFIRLHIEYFAEEDRQSELAQNLWRRDGHWPKGPVPYNSMRWAGAA